MLLCVNVCVSVLALWLANRQCNHPEPQNPMWGSRSAKQQTNKQTDPFIRAYSVWAVMTRHIRATFAADYCIHTHTHTQSRQNAAWCGTHTSHTHARTHCRSNKQDILHIYEWKSLILQCMFSVCKDGFGRSHTIIKKKHKNAKPHTRPSLPRVSGNLCPHLLSCAALLVWVLPETAALGRNRDTKQTADRREKALT